MNINSGEMEVGFLIGGSFRLRSSILRFV